MSAVTLGDSITQNNTWFLLANAFAGKHYQVAYNAGVGGDTTAGMLARVDADVIARHPGAVSLLGGTNDIGGTVPAATIISNLSQIIAKMRADNETVFLGTIPPRCSTVTFDPLTTQQRSDFLAANAWIRSRHNGSTIRVADWTMALSTGGDGTYPNLALFEDHVHPNDDGRMVMANILKTVMT